MCKGSKSEAGTTEACGLFLVFSSLPQRWCKTCVRTVSVAAQSDSTFKIIPSKRHQKDEFQAYLISVQTIVIDV